MIKSIEEAVRARRSVRTFDGQGVTSEEQEQIRALMENAGNPYGIRVDFRLLNAGEHGLSSAVISGADWYFAAKVQRVQGFEEAVGFSFETVVLELQQMGLGTTIIGGTMDRAAFENAMELAEDEVMPVVSPLGRAAKRMSIKETIMRRGVGADKRMDFGKLFFDEEADVPLSPERAGDFYFPLEMVRLGPSAVNKQPWRVIVAGDAAHFYLCPSKGFGGGSTGNMQKIDMGIALCHFALAAKEKGLDPAFEIADPGLGADGLNYTATYRLGR